MKHQQLYSGLIRLHILHHAVEKPIFGIGLMEELAPHGSSISAGTLYPFAPWLSISSNSTWKAGAGGGKRVPSSSRTGYGAGVIEISRSVLILIGLHARLAAAAVLVSMAVPSWAAVPLSAFVGGLFS